MDRLNEICCGYQEYLAVCCRNVEQQEVAIRTLIELMERAGAIHVFGFGRSGAAALAFAIRLRHFDRVLPPVWWVGDQVRDPIGRGDLVLLFTREGKRKELVAVAETAKERHATIAVVTALEPERLPVPHDLVVRLPLSTLDWVYGGGDFELAAYLFQEILSASIGCAKGVPRSDVDRKHV